MNVPPAVMGPLMRLQATGVGTMFAGVSQQIRPWTTDFGAPHLLAVVWIVPARARD
jgi:hypothetical protein